MNKADPGVDRIVFTGANSNGPQDYAIAGHLQTDDVGILWLQNQDPKNVVGVVAQLVNPANAAAMYATELPPDTIFDRNITYGASLAAIYGDPTSYEATAAARARARVASAAAPGAASTTRSGPRAREDAESARGRCEGLTAGRSA